MIALCPNSPQECFDLTIRAFNLSEQFRTPVMFMMDECVGHMTEKVVIPKADQIGIYPRRYTSLAPEDYQPFKAGEDLVPEMAPSGEGYRFHMTGLTHDERGYPVLNPETQDRLVRRLMDKIRTAGDELASYEEEDTEDADVVVVSYGITSRVAQRAIGLARAKGLRVGKLRLITVWPFPASKIRQLAAHAKAFVVPELNMGQMVHEVERAAGGAAKTVGVPHAGGTVHQPEAILKAIEEAAR
jgi:2-oxoglutarate ferredoxin oxidoreductase subunit alpha